MRSKLAFTRNLLKCNSNFVKESSVAATLLQGYTQPLHCGLCSLATNCMTLLACCARIGDQIEIQQVWPIYSTIIAIEVQCMYADYVVWEGGSGGPVGDFFNSGGGIQAGKGKFCFFGGGGGGDRTAQCNT